MGEASVELIFITALVILPLIPAVVLFKVLPSTGEVSGPFKGLNVKFGGAFAAYLTCSSACYRSGRGTSTTLTSGRSTETSRSSGPKPIPGRTPMRSGSG
jgi:hypothetical protein